MNNKKIFEIARNNKKKHNKIFMLGRIKLNSMETLLSQKLVDLEINHEEYKSIINEEENYGRLKENIRNIKHDNELNEEVDKRIENNKYINENNENA